LYNASTNNTASGDNILGDGCDQSSRCQMRGAKFKKESRSKHKPAAGIAGRAK